MYRCVLSTMPRIHLNMDNSKYYFLEPKKALKLDMNRKLKKMIRKAYGIKNPIINKYVLPLEFSIGLGPPFYAVYMRVAHSEQYFAALEYLNNHPKTDWTLGLIQLGLGVLMFNQIRMHDKNNPLIDLSKWTVD
jgi:hypothetical protein